MAFEYDEPEQTQVASDDAGETTDVLSMVNNGPAVEASPEPDSIQGEVDSPADDQTTITETPTIDLYSEEEYAELCRQADDEYNLELQRLEEEYATASVDRAKHQDELKRKKNTEKELLEEIRQLRAEGPKHPSREKPPAPLVTTSLDADGSLAVTSSLDVSEPEHEAYLSQSTRELLRGLEGMGTKKLESIVEIAPTVRDLEALRIKASEQNLGDFKEVLPKGVGTELASRIEDVLLAALRLSSK